jgi:hypothetical protein
MTQDVSYCSEHGVLKNPRCTTCQEASDNRSEYLRGYVTALEDAARVAEETSLNYFSQMEGQGEWEFGMLEFACAASTTIASRIRKLKEGA